MCIQAATRWKDGAPLSMEGGRRGVGGVDGGMSECVCVCVRQARRMRRRRDERENVRKQEQSNTPSILKNNPNTVLSKSKAE